MITMTTAKYLNPDLYDLLLKRFGVVKVTNQGQRRIITTIPNPICNRPPISVNSGGEHYYVNCPYCNDSRQRLAISYMWDTQDEKGRKRGTGLIHCFNEDCDTSSFELELRLYNKDDIPVIRNKPINSEKQTGLLTEVTLPGKCVPLKDLYDQHPARVYLKGRNFDPLELGAKWGLQFCTSHPNPMIDNRIIIPIYWQKKLVGWQARAIGKSSVKYFTMPGLAKSSMLFNGDVAFTKKFGVIVEGVFDAFRVGDHAVALLGKTTSHIQRTYIQSAWCNGAVCVLLDADAQADIDKAVQLLRPSSFKGGIFSVRLPDGKDPGSTDHETLWQLITSAARSNKVDLFR